MSLSTHFSFQEKKVGPEWRETCLREGMEIALAVLLTEQPGLELGLSPASVPMIPMERTSGHPHSPRKAGRERTPFRPRGGCGIPS